MMNIMTISPAGEPALTRHIISLSRELLKQGFNIIILTTGKNKTHLYDSCRDFAGFRVKVYHGSSELAVTIKKEMPDIIHLYSDIPGAMETARSSGIPVVRSIYSPYPGHNSSGCLKSDYHKNTAEGAGLIALHYPTFLSLRRTVPGIIFIPESITPHEFLNQATGPETNGNRLMSSRGHKKGRNSAISGAINPGRDNQEKTLGIMLSLDKSLKEERQMFVKAVNTAAVNLIPEPVSMAGNTTGRSGRHIPDVINNTDIIAGNGRILLEGMACGKGAMIIGSKYAGMFNPAQYQTADLSGTSGKKVCYRDIYYDLLKIIREPEYLKNLQKQGYSYIMQNHHPEKTAQQTISIYEKTAGRQAP